MVKSKVHKRTTIALIIFTLSIVLLLSIIFSCGEDIKTYPYQPNVSTTTTTTSSNSADSSSNTSTEIIPPAPVEELSITPGNGQLTISWENPDSDDLEGILILRRTDKFPTSHTDTTDSVTVCTKCISPVVDTGLTNGTVYYYAVYAYDKNNNYSEGAYYAMKPINTSIQSTLGSEYLGEYKVQTAVDTVHSEYGTAYIGKKDDIDTMLFNLIHDNSGYRFAYTDIVLSNVSSIKESPKIAFNGSDRYGIVWVDNVNGNKEIYFACVDRTGSIVTSAKRITNSSTDKDQVSIAFNGTNYGITWREHKVVDSSIDLDIMFKIINATGDDVASTQMVIDEADINESNYIVNNDPVISSGGASEFGIAYQSYDSVTSTSLGYGVIKFVRVNNSGSWTKQTIKNVTDGTFNAMYPTITFDAGNSNYGIAMGR